MGEEERDDFGDFLFSAVGNVSDKKLLLLVGTFTKPHRSHQRFS